MGSLVVIAPISTNSILKYPSFLQIPVVRDFSKSLRVLAFCCRVRIFLSENGINRCQLLALVEAIISVVHVVTLVLLNTGLGLGYQE